MILENLRIKVNKYKKLRDSIHDIILSLKKDEWINIKDIIKKLEEFNINISEYILNKILIEWMDNPSNNNVFLPTDTDWLYYDKKNKILFSTIYYKEPTIGKYREKIKNDELENQEKERKKLILDLKLENDISTIPNNIYENVIDKLNINLLQDIKKYINKKIIENNIKSPIYEDEWKYLMEFIKDNDLTLKDNWIRYKPSDKWIIPEKKDLDKFVPIWYFKYGKSVIESIDESNNLLTIMFHNTLKKFKLDLLLINKSIRINKNFIKKPVKLKDKKLLYLKDVQLDIPIYHKKRKKDGVISFLSDKERYLTVDLIDKKIKIPYRDFLISQNILIDKNLDINKININKDNIVWVNLNFIGWNINCKCLNINDDVKFKTNNKVQYGKVYLITNNNTIGIMSNNYVQYLKINNIWKKVEIDKLEKVKKLLDIHINDIVILNDYIWSYKDSKSRKNQYGIVKNKNYNYSVEVETQNKRTLFFNNKHISDGNLYFIKRYQSTKKQPIDKHKNKTNSFSNNDYNWISVTNENIERIKIGYFIKYFDALTNKYKIGQLYDITFNQFIVKSEGRQFQINKYSTFGLVCNCFYSVNKKQETKADKEDTEINLDNWIKIDNLNEIHNGDKIKVVFKSNKKNVISGVAELSNGKHIVKNKSNIYYYINLYTMNVYKKKEINNSNDQNQGNWVKINKITDIKRGDKIKFNITGSGVVVDINSSYVVYEFGKNEESYVSVYVLLKTGYVLNKVEFSQVVIINNIKYIVLKTTNTEIKCLNTVTGAVENIDIDDFYDKMKILNVDKLLYKGKNIRKINNINELKKGDKILVTMSSGYETTITDINYLTKTISFVYIHSFMDRLFDIFKDKIWLFEPDWVLVNNIEELKNGMTVKYLNKVYIVGSVNLKDKYVMLKNKLGTISYLFTKMKIYKEN